MSRHPDEPVCPLCHDPIVLAEHWATFICPSIRDGNCAVHVLCLWAFEEMIR